MKMKKIRGKEEYLYLVKWKGYDEETWEPRSNLFCDDILDKFIKDNLKEKKHANIKVEVKQGILSAFSLFLKVYLPLITEKIADKSTTQSKEEIKEEIKGTKRGNSDTNSSQKTKTKSNIVTKGIAFYFKKSN